MTERERLIELLEIRHFLTAETTADFLMDNGVRLPVTCGECNNLMFSDCYGECGKGYLGVVSPNNFCCYGERREDNGT